MVRIVRNHASFFTEDGFSRYFEKKAEKEEKGGQADDVVIIIILLFALFGGKIFEIESLKSTKT